MPKPYPREFRDDVVAVAQRREPGVTIKQIAEDFGILRGVLAELATQSRGRSRQAPGHQRGGVSGVEGIAQT